MSADIDELLGDEASDLVERECDTIDKEDLYLPGPD